MTLLSPEELAKQYKKQSIVEPTDSISSDFSAGYITPKNIVSSLTEGTQKGLKNVAAGVGKLLVGSGQASMRLYSALGGALNAPTLTPTTSFQKALYGTDQPITLRSVGEEVPGFKDSAFAPVVGGIFAAGDLIPGGKITKTAAIQVLKNLNKTDEVVKSLKTVMGVAPKVAEKYGAELARLTDEKSVANILNKAIAESQDIVQIVKRTKTRLSSFMKTAPKEIDELTKKEMVSAIDYIRTQKPEGVENQSMERTIGLLAEKYNITSSRYGDVANRFEDLIEGTKTTGGERLFLPLEEAKKYKNLDDYLLNYGAKSELSKNDLIDIWKKANKVTPEQSLLAEARKYKSAEEFVNGQNKVYRGGEKLDSSLITDRGISFSVDKSVAERFKDIVNKQRDQFEKLGINNTKQRYDLMEYSISKDAKIATKSDIPAELYNKYKQANPVVYPEKAEPIIGKWAKENGFDAIDYRTLGETSAKEAEIKILNPDVLKTKSQLTNIWNKANKTPKEAFGAVAGVEQNEDGSFSFDAKKAVIGIGAATVLSSKPVRQTIKNLGKDLSVTDIDPKKAGIYNRFKTSMENFWVSFREVFDDDWKRVRDLTKKGKYKVDETFDPYDAKIRYYGRVGARIEDAKDTVKNLDKDIIATEKKLKIKGLQKQVDEYLVARHAPERNLVHGDGAAGITTDAAKIKLQQLENLPYSKEVKRIADQIQAFNNKTLKVLYDGQVITKEQFDTLTKTYKNHVPLNRIMEEGEDVFSVLSGKGFDVRGTGLQKAKGSERAISDITTNVVANYEQAVIRAEKNLVDLATLRFYQENKEAFKGIIGEVKPRAIGTSFSGQILLEKITDPMVLALRENGKPVYLKFNDPSLAVAFRGVNRMKQDGLMRIIGSFTRLYAGLMTRFNPEFFIPNKIRDLQETAVYLAAQGEYGLKGAIKTVSRETYLEGERAVLNHIRGVDTPDARLYKQMIDDGGTTGGMGLSTRKQLELDIEKIRKENRSAPRRVASLVVEKIDQLNTIFEDSTRFIAYKQAIQNGVSRNKAAIFAKEASIDFNRMGTGGPIINALYMFSNASIQGSVKMLRAMKNPKVAAATASSVGSAVWAVNEWNEKVDPEWRSKISEWDRLNSFPVMIPTNEGVSYFTIPVSWGLKPIKVSMDYAYDLASGKAKNFKDAMSGIFASVLEAYNPIGGTDIGDALMPTIGDIPLAVARNKSWTGGKIKPDWDQSAPESERYFDSLQERTESKVAIPFTKELAEKGFEISPADIIYAYDQLIGGTGRFVSKTANTIWRGVNGDNVDIKQVPFVSRFLKIKSDEEVGAGSNDYLKLKDIETERSRARAQRSRLADQLLSELSTMPKDEANQKAKEIKAEDPLLFEAVKDAKADAELGLTSVERRVKSLGVADGTRARFIWDKLSEMKSRDEKNMLISDWKKKKIITDSVMEQLKRIKSLEQ